MTTETGRLFERLSPPPGGAAALRRRLRRDRWRRRAGRAALAGAAVLLVAVGHHRLTTARPRAVPAEPHPALVSLGLQRPPAEPASVPVEARHRMALHRVPLETDRVVFYYVAVLAEEPGDEIDD